MKPQAVSTLRRNCFCKRPLRYSFRAEPASSSLIGSVRSVMRIKFWCWTTAGSWNVERTTNWCGWMGRTHGCTSDSLEPGKGNAECRIQNVEWKCFLHSEFCILKFPPRVQPESAYSSGSEAGCEVTALGVIGTSARSLSSYSSWMLHYKNVAV